MFCYCLNNKNSIFVSRRSCSVFLIDREIDRIQQISPQLPSNIFPKSRARCWTKAILFWLYLYYKIIPWQATSSSNSILWTLGTKLLFVNYIFTCIPIDESDEKVMSLSLKSRSILIWICFVIHQFIPKSPYIILEKFWYWRVCWTDSY